MASQGGAKMVSSRDAPKRRPQGGRQNCVPRERRQNGVLSGGAKSASPGRGRQSGVPRVGRQNSVPRVGRPEVVWMVWRLHTSLKYGVAGVFYGLATPGL